jgi:hypothetical protein
MGEGMLLVALGCGRLPRILDIASRHPFVVFGTMEGEVLSRLADVGSTASVLQVFFYGTGCLIPRRVVAVGNLDKVWLTVPAGANVEDLQDAFKSYFGAKWNEVLSVSVAEESFDYHAVNNAYFAVRDIRPIGNLALEQLLETKGITRPPNIIIS